MSIMFVPAVPSGTAVRAIVVDNIGFDREDGKAARLPFSLWTTLDPRHLFLQSITLDAGDDCLFETGSIRRGYSLRQSCGVQFLLPLPSRPTARFRTASVTSYALNRVYRPSCYWSSCCTHRLLKRCCHERWAFQHGNIRYYRMCVT